MTAMIRQSLLFSKTRREAPKDEVALNARLLTQAGFIYKELAGAYAFLPLGRLVLEKLTRLIRRELAQLGASEVLMTSLQAPTNWQATERWDLPVWYKLSNDDKKKSELGLAWTHEEAMTTMLRGFVNSYQDLPRAVHQFQTKFRREERAKSGLLRGREFVMNDLYYFTATADDLDKFYESVMATYRRIFDLIGLGEKTFLTVSSGGDFSPWSHEFQTITDAGEDTIYLDRARGLAVNKEVYDEKTLSKLGLHSEELETVKAIEVGNIFKLGTRFSGALGLEYRDAAGEKQPVVMGSFGLGVSRLVGALVEVWGGEKTMLWPAAIAPALVHLIGLEIDKVEVRAEAENIIRRLEAAGVEVLFDDRAVSAGEKFADADLIGLPHRLIVSSRQMVAQTVEWQNRQTKETLTLPFATAIEKLTLLAENV